jgi:hypothetical protein
VGRLIEDEIACLVDRGSGTATGPDRAAQDRLHSSDQLLRAERLGDVVVGSELEAAQDVTLVLAGGEQEDGDVLVDVADALEDDEAGELGQVDIEDHEVGLFAPDGLDRSLSVVSARDVISLTTKRVLEKLHEVAVVVDNQKLY